jgi:hypothetical protein
LNAPHGDDGPSSIEDVEVVPDPESPSGHSVVVAVVNALMAAMTFGAVASMAMAVGRLMR